MIDWTSNRFERIEYKLCDLVVKEDATEKTVEAWVSPNPENPEEKVKTEFTYFEQSKKYAYRELDTFKYITYGSLSMSATTDIKVNGSMNYNGPEKLQNGKFLRVYYSILDAEGVVLYRIPLATLTYSFNKPKYFQGNISGSLECYSVLKRLADRKLDHSVTFKASSDKNAVISRVVDLISENNIPVLDMKVEPRNTLNRDVTFGPNTSYLEVCNTMLQAVGMTALLVDGYGNAYFEKYVKIEERAVQWEFSSENKSIFLPEVEQSQVDAIPNTWTTVYETDKERIVAVAKNNDLNSPYSIPNVGYEISGEGESTTELSVTDRDLTQEDGKRGELMSKAAESLRALYTYTTTTDFTIAWVPVVPDMAIKLNYKSAELTAIGVIDNMDISLAPGMSTKLSISTVHKDTVELTTTATVEKRDDGVEWTGYTVQPWERQGTLHTEARPIGGANAWLQNLTIFPTRFWADEINTREWTEEGKYSRKDVTDTIKAFTNIDQTSIDSPGGAPWFDWSGDHRSAPGCAFDWMRLTNWEYKDGDVTKNRTMRPKKMSYWFTFDYHLNTKEDYIASRNEDVITYYTIGTNLLCRWAFCRGNDEYEHPFWDECLPEPVRSFGDKIRTRLVPFFDRNVHEGTKGGVKYYCTPYIDFEACDDLSFMFYNIYASADFYRRLFIDQIHISTINWNVSNVKTMAWMFGRDIKTPHTGYQIVPNSGTGPNYCATQKWVVSNLTNMEHMFDRGAPGLYSRKKFDGSQGVGLSGYYGLDLEFWEREIGTFGTDDPGSTTKNIHNMRYAFAYCTTLEYIDMYNWKLPNANIDMLWGMFEGCGQKMTIRLPWTEEKAKTLGWPWGATNSANNWVFQPNP